MSPIGERWSAVGRWCVAAFIVGAASFVMLLGTLRTERLNVDVGPGRRRLRARPLRFLALRRRTYVARDGAKGPGTPTGDNGRTVADLDGEEVGRRAGPVVAIGSTTRVAAACAFYLFIRAHGT